MQFVHSLSTLPVTPYNYHIMGSMNMDPEWATEPIAIIGLSCRFAGDASSPEKLWDMMSEKRSAWSEVPESRYSHKGQYHPENGMLSTVSCRRVIILS